MAIEIIPKKKEDEVSSIGKIALYIGLALLFLSIVASAAFFFLTWRTVQEIEDVRMSIEAKKSPEVLLLEKEMESHHRRVTDFAYLINKRVSPIPMFQIIERTVHPNVYLSGLQINVSQKSVSTTGVARNITAFDQQVKILQNDPMIANASVGNFTRRDDGRIIFPIVINFSEELFNSAN